MPVCNSVHTIANGITKYWSDCNKARRPVLYLVPDPASGAARVFSNTPLQTCKHRATFWLHLGCKTIK